MENQRQRKSWKKKKEGKNTLPKGTMLRITLEFSSETMQARRHQSETFKVLKEKTNKQKPRILYPAKWSFKGEGPIKIFSEKQKLREFVTSRPVLQERLKQVLQRWKMTYVCKKPDHIKKGTALQK